MNLIPILTEQLLDYNNYEQGLLKVIGYPGYPISDCIVKDVMSYSEWVNRHSQYPVIKLEGLERLDAVKSQFGPNIKNIHLFVSQKYGQSFNWHRDNLNVILIVLRGHKLVQILDKSYSLYTGKSIRILKGSAHKVVSKKNTWALSLGY
jgi:mannose-6-phosphate isomerase-like protein (cupin superfamily)